MCRIPEFSLGVGVGRRPGTYQWGDPLKEVDTLPIIDVVRLATLRGHTGRGTVRHLPPSLTPPFQMAQQLSCRSPQFS